MSESPPPIETAARPKGAREQRWWIALAAALIAASAPITATVHTAASKNKELQLLAEEKQYAALDRATNADLQPEARRLVLTFLSAVPHDERLRQWASYQLTDVEGQLKAATARIDALERQYAQAANESELLLAELTSAKADVEQSKAESIARAKAVKQVSLLQEKLHYVEARQAKTAIALEAAHSSKSTKAVTVTSTAPSVAAQQNTVDGLKPSAQCVPNTLTSQRYCGDAPATGIVRSRVSTPRLVDDYYEWDESIRESPMQLNFGSDLNILLQRPPLVLDELDGERNIAKEPLNDNVVRCRCKAKAGAELAQSAH